MLKPNSFEDDELRSLIPKFTERGMDLDLHRMRMALKAMGEPCKSIPAVQIAGTNGKGSIASFLQSSLKALKVKTGITTSPHLVSWRERISIDGELISANELRKKLIHIKSITRKYRLTPFELIIATALNHFSDQQVELLVLEVGLGGRLDATTAHPYRPIIAMAGIGFDHCEYLGDTLEAITKEKASIISPKSTVISAHQHPRVEKVLKAIVKDQKATIHFVEPLSEDWNLGLSGEIQKQNAAVAKGALESLSNYGWEINEQQIREGLANAKWPGRLQKAHWNKLSLRIDCAHNPHATKQISLERNKWKNQELGIPWVIAIQKNKDAPTMLESLINPPDLAWIVPVPEHKSWTKQELSSLCPQLSKQLRSANDVEIAISMILLEKRWDLPSPVITGSIYLIGDLIKKQIINLESN